VRWMCHISGGQGPPEGKARPYWKVGVGGAGSARGALLFPLLSWGMLVVPAGVALVTPSWGEGGGWPRLVR